MSLLFFDPLAAHKLSQSVRQSIDFIQPFSVDTASDGAFYRALHDAVQRVNANAEHYQRFLDRVSANSDRIIGDVLDADAAFGRAMEGLG